MYASIGLLKNKLTMEHVLFNLIKEKPPISGLDKYIKNHRPPTIIKGTCRDVMKGKVVVPLR